MSCGKFPVERGNAKRSHSAGERMIAPIRAPPGHVERADDVEHVFFKIISAFALLADSGIGLSNTHFRQGIRPDRHVPAGIAADTSESLFLQNVKPLVPSFASGSIFHHAKSGSKRVGFRGFRLFLRFESVS